FTLNQFTGNGGIEEKFAILIILTLLALITVLLTIKWLFIRYVRRDEDLKPDILISKAQLYCYGLTISLFYFYGMSAIPSKNIPSWKAHLFILCTGIILYAIGLLLAQRSKNISTYQWRYFLSSFLF